MHVLLHSAGRISSLFVSSFASSAFPGTEQPRTMASDASWGSFGHEMPVEESEVMAQLFGSQSFDQDHDPSAGIQELFWGPVRAAEAYCSSDNSNYDPYSWQQQQANVAGSFPHAPGYNYADCYSSDPARTAPAISMSSTPASFCVGRERIDAPPSFFPLDACHHGNQRVCVNEETSSEEVVDSFVKPLPPPPPPLPPTIEKRPAEGQEDEGQVKSLKRKARSSSAPAEVKKAQKRDANEEESHADMNPPPSPCCYSSEDDSNASPEQKGAAAATSSCSKSSADLSPNGKKRASRGSATDPQSLYARKRRERINERLRILQNLVPNGTKVDISTMLEEAVQYVKFLQLQIKLLSSDELWMYAPIAYNGMNLGLT